MIMTPVDLDRLYFRKDVNSPFSNQKQKYITGIRTLLLHSLAVYFQVISWLVTFWPHIKHNVSYHFPPSKIQWDHTHTAIYLYFYLLLQVTDTEAQSLYRSKATIQNSGKLKFLNLMQYEI